MPWKHRFAHLLLARLSRQETLSLAGDALAGWLAGLSAEEKVELLQSLVEENLAPALVGLSPKERGQLMNALLPAVAREFPLAELDILGAFAQKEEA